MLDFYKQNMLAQFEAALWMLNDCIQKCPAERWSGPKSIIGKYEFWHVVHHTLSCTDGYLTDHEKNFQPHPQFHPAGTRDVEDEYPSRQFSKDEMSEYVMVCVAKLRDAVAAESEATLKDHCGFSWRKINRCEMYMYNMRHVMHHVGMLSAFLRRAGQDPEWGNSGFPGERQPRSMSSAPVVDHHQ
jgi:hypothetical protein